MKTILDSEEATRRLGAVIGEKIDRGYSVLLRGELGAGKSTLARGIFTCLGLSEPFPSPTYLYVVEYPDGIAHIDLYMAEEDAFYRLGLEDYFSPDYITVVEWADRIPSDFEITGPIVEIELTVIDENKRECSIKSPFPVI